MVLRGLRNENGLLSRDSYSELFSTVSRKKGTTQQPTRNMEEISLTEAV